NFRPFANFRILGLYEIPHLGAFGQGSAGANPGKGSYMTACTDHGIFNHAIGQNLRASLNTAVTNHTVGANLHMGGNLYPAFQNDVYVDGNILTAVDLTAHVKASRIGEGHTRGHQ